MSTTEVLTAIQDSALAHAISKSNHLVAAGLQVFHVLGFVVLLAALVLVSLRILGLTFKQQPLQDVAKDAMRLVWLGLGLTVGSGVLMFIATPKLYFFKWVFDLKMLLFVVAVIIQVTLFRKVAASEAPNLIVARTAVGLSLLCWFGIGMAGRMIGFT